MRAAKGAGRINAAPGERRNASALAVERAAEVLLLLGQENEGSLSVSELARSTKASGSAVHRILTALKRKQLIDQDPETQRYFLSWRMMALAQGLTARADLRSISHPYMTRLRDLTNETVTLSVRSGSERLVIEQVESLHEIRWVASIGRLSPLHSGVTGVVLLAHAPQREVDAYLRGLARMRRSDPTAPSRDDVEQAVRRVRQYGYALAQPRRFYNIDAVSAPIFGHNGGASAALTIAGPAERCTDEKLEGWVPDLLHATGEISTILSRQGIVAPGTVSDGEQKAG